MLGSVRTHVVEDGAIGAKKRADGKIVKFIFIIGLECMNGATKLGGHIRI